MNPPGQEGHRFRVGALEPGADNECGPLDRAGDGDHEGAAQDEAGHSGDEDGQRDGFADVGSGVAKPTSRASDTTNADLGQCCPRRWKKNKASVTRSAPEAIMRRRVSDCDAAMKITAATATSRTTNAAVAAEPGVSPLTSTFRILATRGKPAVVIATGDFAWAFVVADPVRHQCYRLEQKTRLVLRVSGRWLQGGRR